MTKRRRKTRQKEIDRIADAIWDLCSPDLEGPVVLRASTVMEAAFAIGSWGDVESGRQLMKYQQDVFDDLQQCDVVVVPISHRALRKTTFTVENTGWQSTDHEYKKEGTYEWKWVSFKTRGIRSCDEGRRRDRVNDVLSVGYLNQPDATATACCSDRDGKVSGFALNAYNWYQIAKSALPAANNPQVAYAVHLPDAPKMHNWLAAAKMGMRCMLAATISNNVVRDTTNMTASGILPISARGALLPASFDQKRLIETRMTSG